MIEKAYLKIEDHYLKRFFYDFKEVYKIGGFVYMYIKIRELSYSEDIGFIKNNSRFSDDYKTIMFKQNEYMEDIKRIVAFHSVIYRNCYYKHSLKGRLLNSIIKNNGVDVSGGEQDEYWYHFKYDPEEGFTLGIDYHFLYPNDFKIKYTEDEGLVLLKVFLRDLYLKQKNKIDQNDTDEFSGREEEFIFNYEIISKLKVSRIFNFDIKKVYNEIWDEVKKESAIKSINIDYGGDAGIRFATQEKLDNRSLNGMD